MARPRAFLVLLTILLLTIGWPSAAAAQEADTRAELLLRLREAKQQGLEEPEPSALERAMYIGEERVLPLLQRDGVYARLGSLSTGSGFAYGAGFRHRSLFDRTGSLDVWAAGSLKKYWAVEGRLARVLVPGDGLVVAGTAGRYSRPSEEFFGLGPGSARGDQASFDLDGTFAGADVRARLAGPLRAGASAEYLRTRSGAGDSDDLPPVGQRFPAAALAGHGETIDFVHAAGYVEVDYREPLNARKGGWYRVGVSRHADVSGGPYTFTRIDVDLRQYASILAERRVFAGHVYLATTDAGEDGQVPFYLLPSLGGNDTLRGFRAHRFRGPHALLLQGEYRFEIWAALEGALFVDAGKVALRRSDLDFRDLERDVGFGFRFNTNESVVARVDVAFGSRDGRHLHVVFGGIF